MKVMLNKSDTKRIESQSVLLLQPSFPKRKVSVSLTATLPLWLLQDSYTADQVLLAEARFSGWLHHQLRVDDKTLAYARSWPFANQCEERTVAEAGLRNPAVRIEKCLEWVSKNLPRSRKHRLLLLLRQNVYAIWCIDKKKQLLILADFPDELSVLKRCKGYREEELAELLRQL